MKILFILFFILASCSGTYKTKISVDPNESLRVAVLPFVSIGKNGDISKEEARLVIDTFSLVSDEQNETPAQIARKQTLAELKNSNFDVISPVLIDVELPHHGYGNPDGSINMQKLYASNPKDICTHLLDCDAVIYGTVKKWDRSYYGIQSVNSVEIEIKMLSGRDNKELLLTSGLDSESRGITKIPTGISSIVVEPIKGLDSNIIVELSNKIIRKMLSPLNLKNRPEYLESGPPVIYATAHDAINGEISNSLVVLLYASEKQIASFSIGSVIPSIPMFEISPGHYYGEFSALKGDSFSNQNINITLKDKYGRSSSQIIPKKVSLN